MPNFSSSQKLLIGRWCSRQKQTNKQLIDKYRTMMTKPEYRDKYEWAESYVQKLQSENHDIDAIEYFVEHDIDPVPELECEFPESAGGDNDHTK